MTIRTNLSKLQTVLPRVASSAQRRTPSPSSISDTFKAVIPPAKKVVELAL